MTGWTPLNRVDIIRVNCISTMMRQASSSTYFTTALLDAGQCVCAGNTDEHHED